MKLTLVGTVFPSLLIAVAVVLGGCGGRDGSEKAERETFVAEKMNGYTPVKDQGRSDVCWVFAMLATIETEHIGRGDSVNLSPYYVVRQLLERDAQRCYISQGRTAMSLRGTGKMLVNAIERYGVVPYDAYCKGVDASITVVRNKVRRAVANAAGVKTGIDESNTRVQAILDADLGPVNNHVYLYSAEYTPQEFARSVCAPFEYESLTSFTHHPFYESFVLETPDNHDRDAYQNVPIDQLVERVERAVRSGHGVCWEGDTSNAFFSFANGVARLPEGTDVTQESRQRAFERFETTDDHCMAIVGIAHDKSDRKYFVMKNSWGTKNRYGGLMYVSFDYVKLYTVAVFLPRV